MPERVEFDLAGYRATLAAALAAGYSFVGFDQIGREASPLSCLLRHDVDSELLGCGPMLDVERELGVRATYFLMLRSTAYNVLSVEGRAMVRRMIADGHQIGLHFMGELCEGDGADAIAAKVLREAQWLAAEFGTPVRAVSFHQPTQAVLDGQLEIPGLVNTYNARQMGPYFYVSDTNMQWRHGHPIEMFRSRVHPRLQLLIHPMWWTPAPTALRDKWLSVLRVNREAVIAHWQARERTLRDEPLTEAAEAPPTQPSSPDERPGKEARGAPSVNRLLKRAAGAVVAPLLRLALRTLWIPLVRWRTTRFPRRSVLYAGQAYYNAWYLSRALRTRGWRADVLNWDPNPEAQMYYHGEDFRFEDGGPNPLVVIARVWFYLRALWTYDVFHFSNAHGMSFGQRLADGLQGPPGTEIRLLKDAGKKIVYSNNGCLDGVSQTSFSKWGEEPVCGICRWRNVPEVCSDERNLAWGRFRNSMADYQCQTGGNRVDYNDDPRVHEVPEFYCLDPDLWRPDLEIPEPFRLSPAPGTVRLYHAVGRFRQRTGQTGVNIKSTHIYLPLVERLKAEGCPVELMFFTNVPNQQVRYYQAQADIFLDMLTFGFFGANAREAMMLGKPVICYLRPEWLASMRQEIPDYVDELPVVSATPATIEGVLRDLVAHPDKRREIGARGRAFALKWHSAEAGARRLEAIYSSLLGGTWT